MYCRRDDAWKIADFGLSAPGTSKRAHTTRYARGTSSYRAPELVDIEKRTFTNKVDIWAIGCILFELTFKKKAFPEGDYAVLLYAKRPSAYALNIPLVSYSIPDERKKTFISTLIQNMLAVDPSKRPPAKLVCEAFKSDIETETPLSKTASGPWAIVRGGRRQLLNIGADEGDSSMRRRDTLGAYEDALAGGVNQGNEAIVQERGGFPPEWDSRLISPEIIIVNMANSHIATVRSTNIEGNLIRIQELRETKTGAVLWRHEQPYLHTARHAFPSFSPEGQYGGFLCGKSIVLVDTRSPYISTNINLPDRLFDVLSFALGPGSRRLAVPPPFENHTPQACYNGATS